jgi:hypothetical protein
MSLISIEYKNIVIINPVSSIVNDKHKNLDKVQFCHMPQEIQLNGKSYVLKSVIEKRGFHFYSHCKIGKRYVCISDTGKKLEEIFEYNFEVVLSVLIYFLKTENNQQQLSHQNKINQSTTTKLSLPQVLPLNSIKIKEHPIHIIDDILTVESQLNYAIIKNFSPYNSSLNIFNSNSILYALVCLNKTDSSFKQFLSKSSVPIFTKVKKLLSFSNSRHKSSEWNTFLEEIVPEFIQPNVNVSLEEANDLLKMIFN